MMAWYDATRVFDFASKDLGRSDAPGRARSTLAGAQRRRSRQAPAAGAVRPAKKMAVVALVSAHSESQAPSSGG